MAAFGNSGTDTTLYHLYYPTSVVSGTAVNTNWLPCGYKRPMSRYGRALEAQREELAEQIRRFGDSALVHAVARKEKEKKVQLDAKSRGRAAPVVTKKKDTRRMQTYDAAMHERQIRR